MARVFQKTAGRETIEPGFYFNHDTQTWEHGFTDSKKWNEGKQKFGVWTMRTLYLNPDAPRHLKRKCVTEREARRALRLERNGVDNDTIVAPDHSTLDMVFMKWIASVKSMVEGGERAPSTLQSYTGLYNTHLKERFGARRVDSLTSQELATFFEDLRTGSNGSKKLAKKTRQHVVHVFGAILTRAVFDRIIGVNPMTGVRPDALPKGKVKHKKVTVLKQEEITKVIGAASLYFRMAITLLIYTGLRVGEVIELRWRDVDFVDGVIRVERAFSRIDGVDYITDGKTDAASADAREIPLTPVLEEALIEQLAIEREAGRGGDDDLVVSAANGERHERNSILAEVKRVTMKVLGVDYTTHKLRHTFISHLINAGADVLDVQEVAGHTKASTTLDIYSHEFKKAEKRKRLREQMKENGFGQVPEEQEIG